MGMPGRVVPWEISWRAVLGFASSFVVGPVPLDMVVVVGFAFEVAFGVAAVGVGSMIAEGAMVAVGFSSCVARTVVFVVTNVAGR